MSRRPKAPSASNVVAFPAGARQPRNTALHMEHAILAQLTAANEALNERDRHDAVSEAFRVSLSMNYTTLCMWLRVGQALVAQGSAA